MIIIPAIDIRGGRCVRLKQGRLEDTTTYSPSPEEMAEKWEAEGAELIHVVDIDGAMAGEVRNGDTVSRILDTVNIPIQIGGGIRSVNALETYLDMGVKRVVLGTKAIDSPDFIEDVCRRFPGKIAIGIDAKDGLVAVKGWKETTQEKAIDIAKRFEDLGVSVIIYTDISRDGMLSGPNLRAIASMLDVLSIPLIASGGVAALHDVEALDAMGELEGVIIGKALYSEAFRLNDAIRLTKSP